MSGLGSRAAAILWKDLLTEWRQRERIVSMLVFTLLLVVIFHFALPGGAGPANRAAAPGLLWAATLFASILGLGRSLAAELENDALSGLALVPGDRGFVLLGKATATWLILLVVEIQFYSSIYSGSLVTLKFTS